MCRNLIRLLGAGLLAFLAGTAQGVPLSIVEVSFPSVNCVFNTNCTITVSDSTGQIAMPYLAQSGTAWLQSRTFAGQPGTPAAGLTGYMYRISLTQASGFGDCLRGFVIKFGPVVRLPYKQGAPPADVFVGSLGGGLGTVGLLSATQENDVITFWLKSPLCVPSSPHVSATTFFIGLASGRNTISTRAMVFAPGNPGFYSVTARAPGGFDTITIPPGGGVSIEP